MNRIILMLIRTLENIFRRPLAALGTFLSLSLLFLLFNLVWISSLSTRNYYVKMVSRIDIEAFLVDSVPDSTITLFSESLGKLDGVESVIFISKDEARMRLSGLMGADLMEGFEENPLPRSLVVSFKENYLTSQSLELFRGHLQDLQGVTEIFYAQRWLEKAEQARNLIARVVFFLGFVIILTATLNLIQAIRFSVRNDRNEIVQVQLMGAGNFLTAVPYILEGVTYALLSAVCSWSLINYSMRYISIREIELLYPAADQQYLFYLAAAGVGLLSGYIGARWKK